MYTLKDYERAKTELERWSDRWDKYDGNNPDKYQAGIKRARQHLRRTENYLKSQGVLEMTDHERLEAELDKNFPGAKSKQIVDFRGKRYRRRFSPLQMSRSRKTVIEWGKSWEQIDDEDAR